MEILLREIISFDDHSVFPTTPLRHTYRRSSYPSTPDTTSSTKHHLAKIIEYDVTTAKKRKSNQSNLISTVSTLY